MAAPPAAAAHLQTFWWKPAGLLQEPRAAAGPGNREEPLRERAASRRLRGEAER